MPLYMLQIQMHVYSAQQVNLICVCMCVWLCIYAVSAVEKKMYKMFIVFTFIYDYDQILLIIWCLLNVCMNFATLKKSM